MYILFKVDVEDYWSCDNSITQLIIDEPKAELNLLTFYFFNITNPPEIIQRGIN